MLAWHEQLLWRSLLERRAPKSFVSLKVHLSSSTKMVDGAARQSGERGLPFFLAPEQSKAKRERPQSKAKQREREREGERATNVTTLQRRQLDTWGFVGTYNFFYMPPDT